MKEFFDAINVYTFGVNKTLADGSVTAATLPDGSLPTYNDDIAEGIRGDSVSGLLQEVAFQTSGFAYGRDLSCADDFTEDFQDVDPNSPLGVAQAAYRRLNTPRGIIPDAPDDGIDIQSYLQRAFTNKGAMAVAGQIKNELLKDDRIEKTTLIVNVITDFSTSSMEIDIAGYTAGGPFTLLLNASDAGVLIKAITGDS